MVYYNLIHIIFNYMAAMKSRRAYEIRKLEEGGDASYICFHSLGPGDFMWHYHDYYEIFAVTKGGGQWQIGTQNGQFQAGEIYLTGSGLPHTYYNYTSSNLSRKTFEATVIMFDFRRNNGKELEELKPLFELARNGLIFTPARRTGIWMRCRRLEREPGLSGLLDLLSILLELQHSRHNAKVVSDCDIYVMKPHETEKLDVIYRSLHHNYIKNITLRELARQVNMSVPGLCAFFKRSTTKSVNAYIHELRIGNACRLLLETDLPITEIALASGYNTISCFNRKFLQLQSCSPRDYRSKIAAPTKPNRHFGKKKPPLE